MNPDDLLREQQRLKANIMRLRGALHYTNDYLNEGSLNAIGNGSKAHRKIQDALANTQDEESEK